MQQRDPFDYRAIDDDDDNRIYVALIENGVHLRAVLSVAELFQRMHTSHLSPPSVVGAGGLNQSKSAYTVCVGTAPLVFFSFCMVVISIST